jgi:hypothetical protein
MKGRQCSVCKHENLAQINAYLQAGCNLKEITTQIPGLSQYSLSRHKRNCLEAAPSTTSGSADPLEGQIGLWLQRSEELYLAGGANLDLRSQGQAISSAFRALEFSRKHQDRVEEKIAASRALPTDGSSSLSSEEAARMREYLDSIISEAARTPYASTGARLMGMEIELEKRSDGQEILELFQRLVRDPALLATVQAMTIEADGQRDPATV